MCIELTIDGKKLVVCNIHTPNHDDLTFFENMITTLESYVENDGILIGEDFNLVMDLKLDRHQSTSNHDQSLNILWEYMDRVNLVETWRALHQHERRYTWHKCMRSRVMSSHLDMSVVSQFWMDCVHRCEIEPRLLSDHSIVQLEVSRPLSSGTWSMEFQQQVIIRYGINQK